MGISCRQVPRAFRVFVPLLMVALSLSTVRAEEPARDGPRANGSSQIRALGVAPSRALELYDGLDIPPVNDPFEKMNRGILGFNQSLDEWVIRPSARVYEGALPTPVRLLVSNVLGNVGDVWTGVNNLLQGKVGDAGVDGVRVILNSTVGLGGLVDFASDLGLPRHKEDFGQTLGRWGVPPGPYLVLPLFGPSNLRDSVATFAVDLPANPFRQLPDPGARNAITVTRLLDARAKVLSADKMLDGISIDRYLFIRDAYLQRRESQIWDGDTPRH